MNSIRAERDRSDYEIYGEFLNLKIDDSFIDEKLEELYPAQSYKGLVPTLSYQMTTDNETKIVCERILPEVGPVKYFRSNGKLERMLYKKDRCFEKAEYFDENKKLLKAVTNRDSLFKLEGKPFGCTGEI